MKRTPKFILVCLACVTLFTSGITANALTLPGSGVASSTIDTGVTRSTAGLTDNRLGSTTAYNDGYAATNATPRGMLYRDGTNNRITGRDVRNYDAAKLPGVANDTNTPSNRGTAINTDNNINGRYGTASVTGSNNRTGIISRDSAVHRSHSNHTIDQRTPSNRGTTMTADNTAHTRHAVDGNHRTAVTGRDGAVHRSHSNTNNTINRTPSNRGTAMVDNNITHSRNSRNSTDGNHRTTVVGNNPIVDRGHRDRDVGSNIGTRNVFRNTNREDGHGYYRHHMRNWFQNDSTRGNYRAYGDGYVNPGYRGTTTNVHRATRNTPAYTNETTAPVVRGRTATDTVTPTVAPRVTTNPTRTATTRGVYRNTVTESRNATITFVVLLVAIAALLALAIYALTRTRHDRVTNTFSDNDSANRRR
jgi:hypothetical protein